MKCRLKCENPGEIVYTIVLTTTAKEWEKLREQLNNDYPAFQLKSAITDVLAQARKIYWAEDKEATCPDNSK